MYVASYPGPAIFPGPTLGMLAGSAVHLKGAFVHSTHVRMPAKEIACFIIVRYGGISRVDGWWQPFSVLYVTFSVSKTALVVGTVAAVPAPSVFARVGVLPGLAAE